MKLLNSFKKTVFIMVVILLVFGVNSTATAKSVKKRPLIQMAILLDTSSSMQGLIAQAKTQLWKIVNEMALAKRGDMTPGLQVALYEYGKNSIPRSEGYLRMLVPLSSDLDKISEELFKLRTNGGSEYCGQVIAAATDGLAWSTSNKELKIIFIAGNEPFTQGSVSYKDSCKRAISKGIIVNTIFCGNNRKGISTMWKDGADLADGTYMNIDHNKVAVHIPAPQDKEIIKLGQALNKTYVSYGVKGAAKKERQKIQDSNALSVNEEVAVQRSVTKASGQYKSTSWDIVDAEKEGTVNVGEMKEAELPAEMKGMNKKERQGYVNKKRAEREKLQQKIAKLKKERDKFISTQKKELSAEDTLDAVMIKAIKEQAKKKKYKFKKD